MVADISNAMSQPLTPCEVGLEISLWPNQDVAQLRARVGSALEIAQGLTSADIRGWRTGEGSKWFDLNG